MTPAELELADTDDLVNELRKRSRVFFLIRRPLNDGEEYAWAMHWGVEGGRNDTPEAASRTLGLIEIGKLHLLRGAGAEGGIVD